MTTQYILANGTLLGVMVPNQYRLVFLRDNNDTIYGFKYYKYVSSSATYNYNQTYYYEFNLQGDVIAIYNASGTLTATYKYDAWGKLLGVYNSSGTAITSSTSIGIINPIRYRGYIYDTETGFYYLQSRYYDPEVGRFLNLDAYINANGGFIGYNMYVYCSNNPILYCDPTGTCIHYWWTLGILDCNDCSCKETVSKTLNSSNLALSNSNNSKEETSVGGKVLDTVGAVGSSITIEIGIGSGFELGASVGNLNASAGVHEEMHLTIGSSGVDLGIEDYEGASAGIDVGSVSGSQIGFSETSFHSYFCDEYSTRPNHDIATCPNTIRESGPNSTISIFDAGAYMGIGFSFGISFDTDRFLEKMDAIW